MQLTAEVISSSRDIAHPAFSLNLGKVLATVMLGVLEGENAFTNPGSTIPDINAFLAGILQIWVTPPAAASNPMPAPVAQPAQ